MRNKPWFAVFYMFAVTAVFSSLLIGFSYFTSEKVRVNQKIAFEHAILEALGLAEGKTSTEIHTEYVKKIKSEDSFFIYSENGVIKGYAVSFAGKGFWAPIKGIMGLGVDRQTIKGVSFYEQNETPGLGGEIVKSAFRDQFVGKKIDTNAEPIGIKPYGSKLGENEVHAITGATQTSTRLEKLMNDDLKKWLANIKKKGTK